MQNFDKNLDKNKFNEFYVIGLGCKKNIINGICVIDEFVN